MQMLISPAGQVRFLYDVTLDLTSLDRLQISRASQVEPDELARWWADLALSNGPCMGPFPTRSQALQTESDWLLQHRLLPTTYLSLAEGSADSLPLSHSFRSLTHDVSDCRSRITNSVRHLTGRTCQAGRCVWFRYKRRLRVPRRR